jgi:hypothetical protein
MTTELQPRQVSQSPETPISFTPVGYVEKLGGQVEAIILQDSEMQIVHVGEHFAGSYRVVKISLDSVEAIDETTMLGSTYKPNAAESAKLSASVIQPPTSDAGAYVASSKVNEQLTDDRSGVVGDDPLGYVEKTSGRLESVVADGDTVNLISQPPAVAMSHNFPAANLRKIASAPETASSKTIEWPARVEKVIDAPKWGMRSKISDLTGSKIQTVNSTPSALSQDLGTTNHIESTAAPTLMTSLGFVEKANGEIEAILSGGDDVYVVRQGDYFAGRYLAAKVSREGVEALGLSAQETSSPVAAEAAVLAEGLQSDACDVQVTTSKETACLQSHRNYTDSRRAVKPIAELASTFSQPAHGNVPFVQQPGISPAARWHRKATGKQLASPDRAPLIFQALGSIEAPNGEVQAIIVDESQVYIVKQGEVFADKYQAISVDPGLVLAIRAPVDEPKDAIFSRANDSTIVASKRMQEVKSQTSAGIVRWQVLHAVGVPVVAGLTDVGVDLFNLSGFMGFDLQPHLVMADNVFAAL